jgi:hypothetical protein
VLHWASQGRVSLPWEAKGFDSLELPSRRPYLIQYAKIQFLLSSNSGVEKIQQNNTLSALITTKRAVCPYQAGSRITTRRAVIAYETGGFYAHDGEEMQGLLPNGRAIWSSMSPTKRATPFGSALYGICLWVDLLPSGQCDDFLGTIRDMRSPTKRAKCCFGQVVSKSVDRSPTKRAYMSPITT